MAKIGYKQSPEHIAKKKRFGSDHFNWKGDTISVRGGRSRAYRLYPKIGPCSICGASVAERHHKDNNTSNNNFDNISILCRRCHMKEDGRLEIACETLRKCQPKAVIARWRK